MIQFKVTAPGILSLFGEHAVRYDRNGLTAAIDLYTTLTFNELSISNSILQINCPQIHLLLNVSLQEFQNLYDNCVVNIELLHEHVLNFTCHTLCCPEKHQIIVQAFFYLLIYITYKEQIEIKSFSMHLSTEFTMDEEFVCPASLTVCLATCLFNWSRLQKGAVEGIYDHTEFGKIQSYAARCEKICSKSGMANVTACIYGSIIKHQIGQSPNTISLPEIPRMSILLVDSKQMQNLEAQTQKVTELMNTIPEYTNYMLDLINTQTIMAFNAFRKYFDIFMDKELSIETKRNYVLEQHKIIKNCIFTNQNLLHALNIPHDHLDDIFLIAQKHGMCGKYTDIGNGRYAYIWCPLHADDELCRHMTPASLELRTRGFDVIETKLTDIGMRIELITLSED